MDHAEFEQIVDAQYEAVYAFSMSLARHRDDACELTQETFTKFAVNGHQLRDRSKVKNWLFTTAYRTFLGWKKRESTLPHFEIGSVDHELPPLNAHVIEDVEAGIVLDALLELDERYRAPLMLHFFDECSYREIAEHLDLPLGTVMSRLSRGKDLVRQRLAIKISDDQRKIVPIQQSRTAP